MLTRTENAGTALEILQAYPLGSLQVAITGTVPYEHAKSILIGLTSYKANNCEVAHYDAQEVLIGTGKLRAANLKPYLRPFNQLCTPLEDGTVPAVEVAKLILDLNEAHCEDGYLAGITAQMDLIGCDCGVYLPAVNGASLILCDDWSIWGDEAMTPPAVYDYLRSKHFAVGLKASQFIEKPASAPTIEKETQPAPAS